MVLLDIDINLFIYIIVIIEGLVFFNEDLMFLLRVQLQHFQLDFLFDSIEFFKLDYLFF
jgi:hypothetical protein